MTESIIDRFHKNWIQVSHRAPKPSKNNQEGFVHVLMIKTHTVTGLKYLCKSSYKPGTKTVQDCIDYLGSGKRWLNHLKVHGKTIKTDIIQISRDIDHFRKTAFDLSLWFDIVKSDDWANLTEEKGDGGLIGEGQKGKTWKIKDTSKMKGPKDRSKVDTTNISGGNNYQSTHFIKTPWGVFETWQDASKAARKERENGNQCVVTDVDSLKRYCKGIQLSEAGRRTIKNWRGKHTHDLGFGMELKNVR